MIRFQNQNAKSQTLSAAERRRRINAVALVASTALIAQIFSACSGQSVPATSAGAQYPDLNDTLPRASLQADQVAQMKAKLVQVRDETQERAAALVAQSSGTQPVLASK